MLCPPLPVFAKQKRQNKTSKKGKKAKNVMPILHGEFAYAYLFVPPPSSSSDPPRELTQECYNELTSICRFEFNCDWCVIL